MPPLSRVHDRKLRKNLIVFAGIMEGLFFRVGFVQILSLGRRQLSFTANPRCTPGRAIIVSYHRLTFG